MCYNNYITRKDVGTYMSFTIKNLIMDKPNPNIEVKQSMGGMKILEYKRDISVTPGSAVEAYYSSEMNVRKRQLLCDLSKSPIVLQAGAMQWMAGDVEMETGVKGAGDLIGKMFRGKVTGESAIKPEYRGTGFVMLEPTYKHLILVNAIQWGPGGITLEDGMFLACESCLKQSLSARSNISSSVAGGEGLFNLNLSGNGVACLESRVPIEDLIEIELDNDTLKIDGNYAVCWSGSLNFTVERSGKTLIGSAASGEGLVNVYRGTGKIWMEPLAKMPNI